VSKCCWQAKKPTPHQWLVKPLLGMLSEPMPPTAVAGSLMCALKAHATLPEALHHSPPGTPLFTRELRAHLLMMPHHSELQVAPMQAPWAVGALPQPHPQSQACPRILGLVIHQECKSTMLYQHPISPYNAIQPNFTKASQPELIYKLKNSYKHFQEPKQGPNCVPIRPSRTFRTDSKNPALDVRYGSPILVPLVQGGVHHATPQRSDHNS
jgi:hypothetical protein